MNFLVVGAINTLFGYSCFAIFLYMGLHYSLASLFATIAGVLFNFKTTGVFVFQSNDNCRLLRFVMVYILVFVVNLLALKLFTVLEVNLYYGGLMILLPIAAITYFLQKKFVFHHA
jgi:putative flippase GtrA